MIRLVCSRANEGTVAHRKSKVAPFPEYKKPPPSFQKKKKKKRKGDFDSELYTII